MYLPSMRPAPRYEVGLSLAAEQRGQGQLCVVVHLGSRLARRIFLGVYEEIGFQRRGWPHFFGFIFSGSLHLYLSESKLHSERKKERGSQTEAGRVKREREREGERERKSTGCLCAAWWVQWLTQDPERPQTYGRRNGR